MADDPAITRIDVSTDKPGRWVEIVVTRGGIIEGADMRDITPFAVTLSVEGPGSGSDHWTWLSPDEARAVAAALTQRADEADARNAGDPRA
jgi:hypothetical protein